MESSTTPDATGDPVPLAPGVLKPKRPRRPVSARKKWMFRLLAVSLVPATLLAILELGLNVCGLSYKTSYFVRAPVAAREAGYGYIVNQDFGRRFFPPGLLRQPLSNALAVPKSDDTYRIFVLGESAALGFPDPSIGFSRILEVMLRERYPGTRFEVINTAMVAINSHVVLSIARDCARHKPDLFVVHLGNNEVVGPFGASGVISPFTADLNVIRNSLAAKSTGIGQLLQRSFPNWGRSKETPRSWKGMSMFLQSQVRESDARLETIRDHFAENLKEICDAGVSAGAAVIVCTIPVNLRDSAPFGSLHASTLSDGQTEAWEQLYEEGIRLAANGETEKAISTFHQAADIDSSHADLQYRLGRLHLKSKSHRDQALRYFSKARDADTLRFRSDAGIQSTIRKVVSDLAPEGIRLVDAEQDFAASCSDGIPGEEFFLEHVHLNFHGNFLLARGVFNAITAILPKAIDAQGNSNETPLSEASCAERLALTDWNRLKLAQQTESLLLQPPFTNQLDAAERLRRLRAHQAELRARIDPATLQSVVKAYEQTIERTPDDWMIRLNFVHLLLERQDPEEAKLQCDAILKKHPYVFLASKKLGDVFALLGRHDRAIEQYRETLYLLPDFAEAEYGLALSLAAEGRHIEGLRIHESRVRRDPDRSAALEQMAMYLVKIGRQQDAKDRLIESLAIDPDNATAHAQIGVLLANDGDLAEAIRHLDEALRIRPGWPQITELLAKFKKTSINPMP